MIAYEYSLAHKFRAKFYIKELCDYIGISRSGYYKWIQRQLIKTKKQKAKEALKLIIKNYHNLTPTEGYRRVRKRIKDDTGWVVSLYMMHQCFKELGIYSKARRRAYRRPKGQSDKFPNIIRGNWETKRPFEKVCSDTTMIVHKGKKYDWNFHIDVFNNEIVGWDVAPYKHGHGVMNHLRSLQDFLRIKENRGYHNKETILHSDQGLVYASKKFERAHQDHSIIRSMSRAGTPTDNPVIESLNGWIKPELKQNLKINDFTDIYAAIELYVNYFNHERPSYKLNYLTPVEYRMIHGYN